MCLKTRTSIGLLWTVSKRPIVIKYRGFVDLYKLDELQITSMSLEEVQSYKYLGSTVNSDNSIEKEIQHRIILGNKAHFANQFIFNSRLVSKKSKLKLYCSIIRPTVTDSCETVLQYHKTNSNRRL
jgi:hypothetical protein